MPPFDSYLFVFTNKACNQIKILYWDKSGFALWLKRLDKNLPKVL
ncbi:MAG: IS66 family insertion sequence element accessory protein TnpB [Oligoflexales bacterium]|nr:IS66 family insertion sequence element accessory protein TnpB [Oligoflexales bacterium]